MGSGRWTVIADDLTGACDSGVVFAGRGLRTRVAFTPEADFTGVQVRIVTTESRALPEEAAIQAVVQTIRAPGLAGADGVYKKIDSTLRGHPGAELAAVMRQMGVPRALVTPAFPGQGRVVRGGRVYVSGVPLEQSEFGRDVPQADLRRLFGTGGAARVIPLTEVRKGVERVASLIVQSPSAVLVGDAETDTDLATLARVALRVGVRLLCGSAGLARALVEELPAGERIPAFQAQAGPVLVVCGSYHPLALRQVAAARQQGMRGIAIEPDDLRISSQDNTCMDMVSLGEHLILSVASQELLPGKESEISAWLAALAAALLSKARVGGLVLTGGETAARVCQALGCAAIDLGGEVRPGVAWGWLAGGPFSGLPVVTKAGGFGDENTLVEIIHFLSG